jgi:predicted dehydrogenase
MSDKKVRIGFVGVGGMGQCAHLRNYVTVPNCEVVAIAELREKTGQAVARRYGIGKVYRDHSDMLAHEKLDALVASQPFTRHGILVSDLAASGLPIFTEKPLAGAIEVAQEILKAEAAGKARHMVGYHKRSDPATRYAKAEIDRLKTTGELGKMKYVRILMPAGDWVANGFHDLINCGDKPAEELRWDRPASDMDEQTNKDYISFVNYYIHQVNLMRHLLGEPYRVTYADPSGVLLAGVSSSGVGCTIEMSPYVTTIDWQESAMVAFEHGYVKITLPAPLASNRPGAVEVFRDPGGGKTPETIHPQLPWAHAMRQQAINFISFVLGEAPAPCEAAEALEDLKVAREYIRLWKGK